MKFIATTSERIDNLPIEQGQLIFSIDERVVYLDTDIRTSFQQIITLLTEEQRLQLIQPLQGFYYIKETNALWSYDTQCGWKAINATSDNEIIYALPAEGQEHKLYIEGTKMYKWDPSSNQYLELGKDPSWEKIK